MATRIFHRLMVSGTSIVVRIALVAIVLATACNVVHLREHALTQRAQRSSFSAAHYPVGDDTLHVWRGGDGPPVLLLHGFGASAIWQWHAQLDALAEGHDVLMPDLLGFGRSSGPGGDPSLEHQVAAVIGLLDELQIDRIDVVGVSYGGLVGYVLAGMHPDRVRRLVLVDSPAHAWSSAEHRAMLGRFDVDSAAELLVPTDPAGVQTLVGLASQRRQWVPPWVARQVIRELYDPHRADQIALLDHLERDIEGLASRVGRTTQPTLVVWGDGDPVFPVSVAWRLGDELSASVVVLPKARHLPNAEHPKDFNRAVLEFLDAP